MAVDIKLSKKDFASDQEVRWCPGCGDYSILAQTQKVLAELDIPREKHVFVSGIGCSSRLPYYLNTYGIHGIHGRAPAIATGLKLSRPDLMVWVVTGDGDGLSIGGNHLLHAMRRNIDINILLFNNEIYGLTKGQASPTSPFGTKTKTSPAGISAQPIHPIRFAIASEATFVARTLDTDPKHLAYILKRAADHKGTSFVEILQNCVIFNDGAFDDFTGREVRSDRLVYLEDGKPLLFGKNKENGIRLDGLKPEIVPIDPKTTLEEDLLHHHENLNVPVRAYLLSRMVYPEYPVPIGVFRCVEKPSYGELIDGQIQEATEKLGVGDLKSLFREGYQWEV